MSQPKFLSFGSPTWIDINCDITILVDQVVHLVQDGVILTSFLLDSEPVMEIVTEEETGALIACGDTFSELKVEEDGAYLTTHKDNKTTRVCQLEDVGNIFFSQTHIDAALEEYHELGWFTSGQLGFLRNFVLS
jgi:hypothetical protein